MCYGCNNCGRCGKNEKDSPFLRPPAPIPCLKCGGLVDPGTGVCGSCGTVAFTPMNSAKLSSSQPRS